MIPAVRPILGGLSANNTEQLRDLTVSVRAEEPWESLIQNYEEEKKKQRTFCPLHQACKTQALPVNMVQLAVLIGCTYAINSLSSYFEV